MAFYLKRVATVMSLKQLPDDPAPEASGSGSGAPPAPADELGPMCPVSRVGGAAMPRYSYSCRGHALLMSALEEDARVPDILDDDRCSGGRWREPGARVHACGRRLCGGGGCYLRVALAAAAAALLMRPSPPG
jgi:hypothetical protein